jgi:thiopeptide-type bacteriocin biosynthesis protein
MEQWVEVNLFAKQRVQNDILLDVLKPFVVNLRRRGVVVNWHFFREPEIRFRVRLKSKKAKVETDRKTAALAESLRERGLVSKWHFGGHGEKNRIYAGEEDRYGHLGWRIAQDYFNDGAEVALQLLSLKREGKLENPLWAKGLEIRGKVEVRTRGKAADKIHSYTTGAGMCTYSPIN